MIIKSDDFDYSLMNDLNEILPNKNSKTSIKGSYKIKKNGDYITDIDVQTDVIYNQTLLNILINKIERAKSFIFIQMSLGFKKEFEIPWKIDNIGGCEYNPQKVDNWYVEFKKMNLVPEHVYANISTKLFSTHITLKHLIDIENELHKYSEIIWRLEDIKRGYIYFLNKKYILFDLLKNEQPVLEFVYKYRGDFCLVDLALNDYRYDNNGFEHDMYKYYTQDWYKIMKLFRWRIKQEYREQYLKVMKRTDLLMAIYNKIILIEKVYKYGLLNYKEFLDVENDIKRHLSKVNIKFDDYTKQNINKIVGTYLEKHVNYFKDKINDTIIKKFTIQYERGIESQILVDKKTIEKRIKNNIKCPFFMTDIEDYIRFINITSTLKIDFEKTVKCFEQIKDETGETIKSLLDIAEEAIKNKD